MERATWYLRQLLPLHYRTRYTDAAGRRHFVVWRMWMGRSFAVDDILEAQLVDQSWSSEFIGA